MRSQGNAAHEGSMAVMAMAGLRLLLQATHTATASSNTSYTVQSKDAKRVIACHLGTGAGDIRVNQGAAATSSHVPLIPQRYLVFDAGVGETIQFYNTTAGNITIYILETK